MARYQPSDFLPSEVLEREDFRQACSRRDLGAMLQLASKWGGPGFTISHIARRCVMSVGQVQAYIKSGRQAQGIEIFERVADGLHIPGSVLGITVRPWEQEDRKSTGEDHSESPLILPNSPDHLITAPGLDEDFDVLMMIQEADRTDIGPGTIDSLYAIFDRLCRDYPSVSAPELLVKLKRLYSRTIQLRQGRLTLAQHRELIAVSGWITALLACVEWDMNEREAAEAARSATARFAEEIGHLELMAWSYELEAWFALTEGRHGEVARIAKAGQEIGGLNSAIVQLVMQEARGWARMGERRRAETAMERGYGMLQELPSSGYQRHFFYDSTKFPFYAASCYQWLGDDAKAEEFAEQVLRDCVESGLSERSPMRMAETHITLGLVHTHRRDVAAAIHSGIQALSYERKTQPHLVLRLTELQRAVMLAFPRAREALDFDERLKALHAES